MSRLEVPEICLWRRLSCSKCRGVPSLADLSETPSINGEHVVMIRLSQRPRKRLEPRQSASIFGRNERGCWFHRCFFEESPITQMDENIRLSTFFFWSLLDSLHRSRYHFQDFFSSPPQRTRARLGKTNNGPPEPSTMAQGPR